MTLPDLEDLNLFLINFWCIFVIVKSIIHIFYFIILVRFVDVSVDDFGAGDDVAVVLGLGGLEVAPGAPVTVGAVPGGLPELPVDVADAAGWVVGVSGTPVGLVLVPASGTASSASPASSVVPTGWLPGSGCRDFYGG